MGRENLEECECCIEEITGLRIEIEQAIEIGIWNGSVCFK